MYSLGHYYIVLVMLMPRLLTREHKIALNASYCLAIGLQYLENVKHAVLL